MTLRLSGVVAVLGRAYLNSVADPSRTTCPPRSSTGAFACREIVPVFHRFGTLYEQIDAKAVDVSRRRTVIRASWQCCTLLTPAGLLGDKSNRDQTIAEPGGLG
jgi:hypothetical protein